VLATSCLSPCHGFTGIVEQWKSSTHFATFISTLGTEEVESWTGASACGNCHAIDGLERRVAGEVKYAGTTGPAHTTEGQINYLNSTNNRIAESTYAGHANVAVVHCTTCHEVDPATDPHNTGADFAPGSFPLRAGTGAADQTYIEKSSAVGTSDGTTAGQYGVGNACIWCHKSRKDVTNYIGASTNLTSTHWGPHEGPQADVYSGKGGYHFGGRTYNTSSHQAFDRGCVDCHMPAVASNQGIGDHSFYPQLSSCQQSGCHATATSFDVLGRKTQMEAHIQELRVALNDKGWLTRSETAPYDVLSAEELEEDGKHDSTRPGATGLTRDEAGALYNYFLVVRGSAGGVHNPVYTVQLVYDSIVALGGTPTFLRPTP
jgi:hypothetical protein